jgi:hypothetical protein
MYVLYVRVANVRFKRRMQIRKIVLATIRLCVRMKRVSMLCVYALLGIECYFNKTVGTQYLHGPSASATVSKGVVCRV